MKMQKKSSYKIVVQRKHSQDNVKAADLFTRIITDNIIRNCPNKEYLKKSAADTVASGIES